MPSSINEAALNTFELYPNPTTSAITLNNLQLRDEVSVYNTLGQDDNSIEKVSTALSINMDSEGNTIGPGQFYTQNTKPEKVIWKRKSSNRPMGISCAGKLFTY